MIGALGRGRLGSSYAGPSTPTGGAWDVVWGDDVRAAILAETLDDAALSLTIRPAFVAIWASKALPYEAILGHEIVNVTARAANVWTIERGRRQTTPEPHLAGGEVRELPHTIVATKGARTWDLTAIVQRGWHHKTAIPGGEAEILLELDTYAPADWLVSGDATVKLHDGVRVYQSGLVGRPSIKARDDGGAHITLTCRGFQTTLDWDSYGVSRKWPAYTPGYQVFRDVRNEKCPRIGTASPDIASPGQSLPAEYEAAGKKPRGIFDEIAARGDIGQPVDWGVFTDWADGVPKLYTKQRSNQTILAIPRTSLLGDLDFAWDTANQITKVVVKYKGGYTGASAASSDTKSTVKDYSNQIEDWGSARGIAQQILTSAQTLEAVSDSPFVVQYPRPVFVWGLDGWESFPIWLIQAGMLAQLVEPDTMLPIAPWNPDLPIGLMQIKTTDCDHGNLTNTLSLGEYMPEYAYQGLYLKQEMAKPDSPLQQPISGSPAAAPPGVPVGISTSLPSLGSGGIGDEQVAHARGEKTIWYAITGAMGVDGPQAIVAQREWGNDIPIDQQMSVIGFRLTASGPEGEGGNITISVGHGTPDAHPAAGTLVGAPVSSGGATNIGPNYLAETDVVLLEPEDYLSVTVDENDTVIGCTLGIIVRLGEGSSRPETAGAPADVVVSAETDEDNVTTFTINADRPIKAQIEYGEDTSYGGWSAKNEVLGFDRIVTVTGLVTTYGEVHYRAHAWGADDDETIGADQTL